MFSLIESEDWIEASEIPGLVFCMDYLEKNIDWLKDKLEPLIKGVWSKTDPPSTSSNELSWKRTGSSMPSDTQIPIYILM
jgi:hypothetical protein